MAFVSPLKRLHQEAEASLVPYGPALPQAGEGVSPVPVEVVETFGELELEYAAIRKSCVVIDQPNRGVIEVTGMDRLSFLDRMITQDLKDLSPFRMKRSFWLNRKGRIDADLRVIDLPTVTLLDMDVHAVKRTLDGLGGYIVTEDVHIRDVTESTHRLGVHGPTAFDLIAPLVSMSFGAEASGPGIREMTPGRASVLRFSGAECVLVRDDTAGEIGLELIVPLAAALPLYQQLIEIGVEHEAMGEVEGEKDAKGLRGLLANRIRLRPAGWHAYNIARIEAGTPLYNVDFGPESLPAETGVLQDRVSFKKGCYLGQEVVARMHARHQARQQLAAIRFEGVPSDHGPPPQPVTGSPVFPGADPAGADPIGVVTSSTVSPMLGSVPVAFAQLKPPPNAGSVKPGTEVCCPVDGSPVRGKTQEGLRFWTRDASR